ncbi:hypothetical protein GCM10011405_29040 [Rufibacter glacialis]|nr:hypothetical protein GCM10011405_29040 [Rufibacter glacialis]
MATLFIASQKTFTIPGSQKLLTTAKLTISDLAELVQEGEIENRGTLQLLAGSRLRIKNAAYKSSALIWAGTEEIDANSEIRIESAEANALLFSNTQLSPQAHGYWFGKVTLALPNANTQWQLLDSSAPLAAQGFQATLAASSSLVFLAGPNLSLQFGQHLTLAGGSYVLQNQTSGTGNLSVAGDLVLQQATLTFTPGPTASVVSTLDLKGNLTTDAASVLNSNSTIDASKSGIRFNGTSWQMLQAAGPVNHVSLTVKGGALVRLGSNLLLNPTNSVYASTLAVENGGTLDFATDAAGQGYQVQGQGYFRLEQGGTLFVTSAAGINATGLSGNVQVSDSRRSFNHLATYVYNGKVPQQTGTAFPTTASGKIIIIDNPTTVTVTSNVGISSNTGQYPQGGRLEIRNGTLVATASGDVTGSGKLVMSGGAYQIHTLNTTVPLLSGDYELTGGTVELAGQGNQIIRGGASNIYHNLLISGKNEPGISSKTISTTTTVNQNLTILPNAILDITNKSLKGDAGLTMTGGVFRTSRTGTTFPELDGKNTPYTLSGGTIEFYGTINGQHQSIRGTYGSSQKVTYQHLLLTAAVANTMNESGNQLVSANFDVSGTLTVKAPAVFQIGSNRAVGGTGNFVLEPGATLLYGSPQGITASGTGTSAGNVRVSGTRSFSAQAHYGFIGNSEMVTGEALPSTVAQLLVAKTGGGVTLSKAVSVSQGITLKSGIVKTEGHELSLLNQDPNALKIVDASLYIQGNLRRAVGSSGTYSFPVGNSAGKRNVDLISNGLSGNGFQSILVNFTPLSHHQDQDLQVTEESLRYAFLEKEGVWQVQPNATPATGKYTAQASLLGFPNVSDNRFGLLTRPMGAASGKEWTTGGGTLEPAGKEGRTVVGGYAQRNNVNAFGQLALGTVEGVLPVTWLHVRAEWKNLQVQVQWATAMEVNNDRFEVEVSEDGKRFQKIGTVSGKGNSQMVQHYSFLHTAKNATVMYYRVKQIDYDGKYEYSKVVAVKAGGPSLASMTLYPNPSQDYLYLRGLSVEPTAVIEIMDIRGNRVIQVKPVQHEDVLVIPVQHLAAGAYLLRIQTNTTLVQERFVKQ